MKIGWIGVGNMGKPMAKHIQEYASEFTVCDLNQEAAVDILENGGKWAETPSECAQDKDILFMSLPMPQDVEKVSTGKYFSMPQQTPCLWLKNYTKYLMKKVLSF